MKRLSPEQYQEYAREKKSFQTLGYDTVIVKRKKTPEGVELPEVEEAYLLSDLIEALKKKK